MLRIVDEATAKAIGRLLVRQVVDGDEHIRSMVSDEEFAAREAKLATSEQYMRQALARGKVDIVEPVMTQFLGLKGIRLDCDAADRQLRCKYFLNTYTEGLQHQRRRSQGEIVVGAEIAADTTTFQGAEGQPGQLTLNELFTDWRDAIPGRNTTALGSKIYTAGARPTPAVTMRVCPNGCVCQAVLAPGAKVTIPAPHPRRCGSLEAGVHEHRAGEVLLGARASWLGADPRDRDRPLFARVGG